VFISIFKHGVRWFKILRIEIDFQHEMDIIQVEASSSTTVHKIVFPQTMN
jgi:hypothetical protein